MSLEEFWETTPGEVGVAIYAAGERRADDLERGVYASIFGRVASHERDSSKRDALLSSLSRRGRRRKRRRDADEKEFRRFIAAETARAMETLRAMKARQ